MFSTFFTDDFLDSIVFQGNLHASQVMSEESFSNWHKICHEELKACFGFFILMGINCLPLLEGLLIRSPIKDSENFSLFAFYK